MKSIIEKLYFLLVFGEVTIAWAGIFDRSEAANTAATKPTNPILLALNTLVVLGTIYYAWPMFGSLKRLVLQLRWVLPLYTWMFITVLWSINQPVSLIASIRVALYLLSAGVIALRFSTERLLHMLARGFLVEAVLSVAWQFLAPLGLSDDGTPGWTGIFPHKNVLGVSMMLAVAVLFMQKERWSISRLASLTLCTALLVLSQSYTSLLAAVVTVLFIISRRIEARSKAMIFIVMLGTFCILLILSDPLGLLFAAGGKSSNLTGRDALWAFALNAIMQQPLQGFGYGAFWVDQTDKAAQGLTWSPPHAHNGALQVTLDLGLVGLGLTLAVMVGAWQRARRIRKMGSTLSADWMQTLIVMAFMHNLTEADLVSVKIMWFLLMVGCFACVRAESESLSKTFVLVQSEENEVAMSGSAIVLG